MIASNPIVTPQDMAQIRAWFGPALADPATLPVSFVFDGTPVTGIPAAWNPTARKSRIDANILQTVYEGRDPSTGLTVRVECLEYRDYPVVEWTAWLKNEGTEPTPILSDFCALDYRLAAPGPARLVHCNGDFYSPEGYTPTELALEAGQPLTFAPTGGRPCDQAFPYFRMLFPAAGLTLAVGWPAQWSARFEYTQNAIFLQAGQEKTHLRLLPDEIVRSPRITVLAWAGDESRAVNLWRRWYLAHVLPRPDGRPMRPQFALAATDPGEEFTAATEQNQVRYMERFREAGLNFDVWWIDAGWYPCYNEQRERKWWLTGSWLPDPERFPNGLRPVSEGAARHGSRLLLWFEPERVTKGSRLDREHPEWLLHAAGEELNRLLDLGNPECRAWLTDHVCDLIQKNGIGIYRQDFNFEPLRFWRENEAEDRQGTRENFHVQGYLQYWDDLLARNPGLWIDSCASGGRRNDLETMRRAVPLHYTDSSYGVHAVKLAFTHTLYEWIPYFKEWTLSWDLAQEGAYNDLQTDQPVDSFSFHCGFGPMLFASLNIRTATFDHAPEIKMVNLWRRAAPFLLYGDYYPITPFSSRPDRWEVRQFHQAESGEGLFHAIRLPQGPEDRFVIRPHGLAGEQSYHFENPETGETRVMTGDAAVREGFVVELPPRSGAMWFYRPQEA